MDAPDKPSETPATTNAALPNTSPTTPAPAPTPKNPFPELDKSLGVVASTLTALRLTAKPNGSMADATSTGSSLQLKSLRIWELLVP